MPPPAAPSQVIFASSSCACATSAWSFWACFINAPRSGIFPLDIGLDLLDLGPKRLDDVLGDRMLAGLGLAPGALAGGALAGCLEHAARRIGFDLARRERADRDLRRATVVLAKHLAQGLGLV